MMIFCKYFFEIYKTNKKKTEKTNQKICNYIYDIYIYIIFLYLNYEKYSIKCFAFK